MQWLLRQVDTARPTSDGRQLRASLSASLRPRRVGLLEAYVEGLPPGVSADDARLGAQVTAVYTALSRAEWALARVAGTPGALVAKYRHPSVAPYLRSLQRQSPQIEALI